MAHCTPADQVEDLQERCYKYSQKALGFETCTFVASCFAAPVVSSTGSITTLIVAAAGLLVAISIELFSLMKKSNTKLFGRGLVYLSSSLLILTTFLMFISFDKRYAYGILSVPLLIVGAALFQHKMLPVGVHDNEEAIQDVHKKEEEAIQEELDNIFDLWAIILNFGGFVTLIFTYNMQAEHSSASVTGFLFMFTIVLSLFDVMVAVARPVALARLATYLHYLLTFLFVGTLTSTLVTAAKSLDSSG